VGLGIVLRVTRIEAQQHNLCRLGVSDEWFGYGLKDDSLVCPTPRAIVLFDARAVDLKDIGTPSRKFRPRVAHASIVPTDSLFQQFT
jgi:hypothetical protein